MTTQWQILDDRSPAVVYSPGWLQAGSSDEFNGTSTYAKAPGLTATLVFQGIQVSVYGTVGSMKANPIPPQSSYTVDGKSPVTYQAVENNSTDQYNTRFYGSPLLSNGQHTLVVTNLIGSDALYLDYFVVLEVVNIVTSAGASVASTKSSEILSTSTTSQTPTAITEKGRASSKSGTILGSAIGGAALVILIAVIMFWWLRGRNRRTHDNVSLWTGSINTDPPMGEIQMTSSSAAQSGSAFAYQTRGDSTTFGSQPRQNLLLGDYNPFSSDYDPQVSQPSDASPGRPDEYLQNLPKSLSETTQVEELT